MKRWKTLRDSFVREYRCVKKIETGVPAIKKKKYVFYDQLSFLLPHVKGNENTFTNIPPADDLQVEELEKQQAVDEPEVSDDHNDTNAVNPSIAERKIRQDRVVGKTSLGKTLASASKNITTLMQESIALQKADINAGKNNDKFGNKAFLMSFVPLMDSLPPYVALDVRMKITETFRDATRTQPQFNFDVNMQDYSRSSTPISSNSDNMQMRNPSSSSTPCSSTHNTAIPSASLNNEEYMRLNYDINDNSNNEPFNISDYVKIGIMPGHEHD